jgi:hypothetical protein
VGYLLNIIGVNVVQFLVLTWFFAPYNSTGVADHLPPRSALHSAAAVVVVIGTAVWLKRSVPPRFTSRPLISKRTFILLDRGCTLVAIIAILRLTAPLLSIGGKIAPTGYFSWIGVLFVAAVLVKVLPAMIGSVLPSMDEVLASDPRKPILYLRSFEREQSKTKLRGALLPYLQKDPFEGHYMSSGTGENKYMSSAMRGDSFFGGRLNARGILRDDRRAFDEQLVFARAFGAIGPYIALGRPSENYQDMDLGAAKKYVSNDEWQAEVERWLNKSAAVVIESADSAGLGWEIQCARLQMKTTRLSSRDTAVFFLKDSPATDPEVACSCSPMIGDRFRCKASTQTPHEVFHRSLRKCWQLRVPLGIPRSFGGTKQSHPRD